jgi:tetratricopeptide (TPR) repeat protein
LANLTPLSNAVKKYPLDYRLKFLQQAFRQAVLLVKVAASVHDSTDPGLTKGFQLTDYDKAEIKRLESFYLSSLSNNTVESRFLANKLLAGLYMLTGEYEKALPFARYAIKIKAKEASFSFSNASELYDLMTVICLMKKDTLSAEKIVREKISNEKESYQSADDYCTLARFEFRKKDLSETEKACKLALEIDPMTQDAFIGLATASILKGEPETAKDYLLKASSCGNDNAEIKTLNGIIWMEVGDYHAAFHSFTEAIELNKNATTPKSILKHYFRD